MPIEVELAHLVAGPGQAGDQLPMDGMREALRHRVGQHDQDPHQKRLHALADPVEERAAVGVGGDVEAVERVVADRRPGRDEPAQVAGDQLARRVAHVPGGQPRPAVGDDAGQLRDVASASAGPAPGR